MSARRPLAVAHRAGNRLEDLRMAEALGVDLIEADVHWYFGRLEVRHEKTLGPLPVFWERWRFVRLPAPRLQLDRLLEAAAPGTELMLDLKGPDPRLARAVAAAVSDRDGTAGLTVSARNWWLLRPFAALSGVRRVRSVGSRFQLKILLGLTRGSLDGVSIHEELLDMETVRSLHRRTPLILTWGARTAERVEQLRQLGVDGIITEDPAFLRMLLSSSSEEDRRFGG